jgi:uncharacterized lipoprotein YehR (DUF1307 family)
MKRASIFVIATVLTVSLLGCSQQAERETRKQELGGINSECAVCKNEVGSAEAIKRFAVKLMLPDEPQLTQQKTKSREVEL